MPKHTEKPADHFTRPLCRSPRGFVLAVCVMEWVGGVGGVVVEGGGSQDVEGGEEWCGVWKGRERGSGGWCVEWRRIRRRGGRRCRWTRCRWQRHGRFFSGFLHWLLREVVAALLQWSIEILCTMGIWTILVDQKGLSQGVPNTDCCAHLTPRGCLLGLHGHSVTSKNMGQLERPGGRQHG